MISIATFLGSAIGKWLLISGVVAALLIGVRQSGYNAATRNCEAAALRQDLRNKDIDIAVANDAAKAAADEAAASERRAEENKQRADEYEKALKERPNGSCLLTDDDVRILRGGSRPGSR